MKGSPRMAHGRSWQFMANPVTQLTQHSLDCSPLLQPLIRKGGKPSNTLARFRQQPSPHARSGSIHDPSPVLCACWCWGMAAATTRLGPHLEEESGKSASPMRVLKPLACQRAVSTITFHARSSAHSFWKLLAWDQPDRQAKRDMTELSDQKIKGRHCTRVSVSVPVVCVCLWRCLIVLSVNASAV
jgi:hypothetical protein